MSGKRVVLESGMTFLHGKYRLRKRLGGGGMGQVWAAVHVLSNNPVAIKVLHEQSPSFVLRFNQEWCYYAKVRHPNIVTMYDAGVDEHGVLYIVMEFVTGRPLRDCIHVKPLSPTLTAHIGFQGAEALDYMIANGIWHRDIKPDNFMVGNKGKQNGHLTLIDLGIAKFVDPDRAPNTDELPDVGTVQYMAPERIRHRRDIDHRSDIWSFGVTLYEALSGQYIFPFGREATPDRTTQLMHAIVYDEIRPLQELVPKANEELSSIIMRCLNKNPQDRPDSFEEIASVLDSLVRSSLPPDHYAVVEKERRRLEARRVRAFANEGDEEEEEDAQEPRQRADAGRVEHSGVKVSCQAYEPAAAAMGDAQRTTLPMPETSEPRRNALPFRLPTATAVDKTPAVPSPRPPDDGEVGLGRTLRMSSGGSLVTRARARGFASAQIERPQAKPIVPVSPTRAPLLDQLSTPDPTQQRGTPTASTMTTSPRPSSQSLTGHRGSVTSLVLQAGGIGAAISLAIATLFVGIAATRHGINMLAAPIASSTSSAGEVAGDSTRAPPVASVAAAVPALAMEPTPATPAVTAPGTVSKPPTASVVAPPRSPTPPMAPRRAPKSTPFVPLVGDDDQPVRHRVF